ncbi:MAG: hypothetical protein CMF52_06790 [Legionellales bacterium]|nr:hypothetical protein [Legionellales bacterium]|tara:strand:- start:6331 stop:6555 length:225 start_codon:yes stop_codon:yes gene_type:complete
MTDESQLEVGDYVVVVADADHFMRPDSLKFYPKAVILKTVGDNWSRVFLSSQSHTKILDMPNTMLRKIDGNIQF